MHAPVSLKRTDQQQISIQTLQGLQPYESVLNLMDEAVQAIQKNMAPEQIWFLEHEPVFTLGTSGKENDVINAKDIPTIQTGRGGQVTYHGPGQLVTYLMIDLKARKMDLKAYVWTLEEAIINTLRSFDIQGFRREGRVGIWVPKSPTRDLKIAALGVRIQKWVTSHGLALNIDNDLSPYDQIVPCGIKGHGVTNIQKLRPDISASQVQNELLGNLLKLF